MLTSRCKSITTDSSIRTQQYGISFTRFNRKHHCRLCGKVVCSACSKGKLQIVDSKPVRACFKCLEERRDPASPLAKRLSALHKQRTQLDKYQRTGSCGEEIPSFTLTELGQNVPSTPWWMLPLRPMFSQMSVGTLDLEIVSARNLKASDFNLIGANTSDPYCTIEVNNCTMKTKTVPQNLNPIFNQCYRVSLNQLYGHIRLRVYDEDMLDADDFLGGVTIPLLSLIPDNTTNTNHTQYVEGWFELCTNEQELYDGSIPPTFNEKQVDLHSNSEEDDEEEDEGFQRSEILIRARVTTNVMSKLMSSMVPVKDPLNIYTASPTFDIDLLWSHLNRCLSFVYPVLDSLSSWQRLRRWEQTKESFLCVCVLLFLSVYSLYIPLYLHVAVLRYMLRVKNVKNRLNLRPNEMEEELTEKPEKQTAEKPTLLIAALRRKRRQESRGGGELIDEAKSVLKTKALKRNTQTKTKRKMKEEENEEEEKEDGGFGIVVHSLLAFMPSGLKETVRTNVYKKCQLLILLQLQKSNNCFPSSSSSSSSSFSSSSSSFYMQLTWAQELLNTLATLLETIHDLFHWKSAPVSWGVFAGISLSAVFVLFVPVSVWCSWLGVLFCLSGTTLFGVVMQTLVGFGTTLKSVLSPPKLVAWMKTKKEK